MRKMLLLVAILTLLGFAAFAFNDPVAFRRSFVMKMQMEEMTAQVFLGKDLPAKKSDAFLEDLSAARIVAADFFGTLQADPVIAFADHRDLKEQFAVDNPFASSYFHYADILVVIAPRGNNRDVLAHALAHAEVKHRLGADLFAELPAWFDEGLCTQLDRREFLSDAVLQAQEAQGIPIPSYTVMSDHEWFLGPEGEAHLVFAKREVRRWLQNVGPAAVPVILQRVAEGEDFMSVYRVMETEADG